MPTQHEYLIVPIPGKFLTSLWLKYAANRQVSVMVMYSITDNKVSVDVINAVASKHKAIMWSEAVYGYIDDYVASHHNLDYEAHSSLAIPLS